VSYVSFILPNGLRVLYSEDHSTPVVTVDLWYYTGARNERPGRSGFAHLFEHMMFQGSAHVKKSEHFQLVERAGRTLNGSTHDDYTNYYETIPSNRLNLALWLEADRMRSLAVTQENLENQRATVEEEKRLRVDNQPYAPTFRSVIVWPFDSATCFAYAHPTIGSMGDLDAAKLDDVQAYFSAYYAPNNATLVVVGDFRPDELPRARNAFRADFIHERETTLGRAEALQHCNLFHGSVAEINGDLDRYLAVSAADVQRAAAKYLDPANSVVVIVRPKAAAPDSGATK